MVPVVDLKKTGENIKELRKKSGLSVRELADELGFRNTQSVYKWQQGDHLPTVDNFLILSKLFGVKIEDILVVK